MNKKRGSCCGGGLNLEKELPKGPGLSFQADLEGDGSRICASECPHVRCASCALELNISVSPGRRPS